MTITAPSFETLLQHAWQAGMIDGEGCLTIARQIRRNRVSPAFRVQITVGNTDKRLLMPFFDMWQGGIYRRPDARLDKEQKKKLAVAWTWHCPDKNARSFLIAMLPYLRGKKQQTALLIDFIDHKKTFARRKGGVAGKPRGGSAPLSRREVTYRTNVWNRVRKLNRKGRYSRKESTCT